MKNPKADKLISLEHKPASTGDNMPEIAAAIADQSSHPSAYVSHPSLPKMKVGQKVKLHGVVSSFTNRTGKDGEEDNSADISLHHMEPIAEAMEGKKSTNSDDEEAIENGMRAAENNNDT